MFRIKTRLDAYEGKVITAALPSLVDANESAGVIQALLNRESQLSPVKDSSKRQVTAGDRDTLLLTAVNASNLDLVWLLAPQATLQGRNLALATALSKRTSSVVSKLLEYDADPSHCSVQFIAAAAAGDYFILEHLLAAPRDIPQATILAALTPAAQSKSLRTIQRIVDTANLGGAQDLEAVKVVIDTGHVDALICILLATRSIRPDFLDDLVFDAFQNADIDAESLYTILHALLLAGASGPKSSAAMRHAVEKQALNLVQLFASHGVDINWGKGGVVKSAVETGRFELLQEVLRSGSLSKENASLALQSLPNTLPSSSRYEMLKALVEAGAYGPPLEKELILAVRNDDRNIVGLLRASGVSIDTQQGEALIAAIQRGNVQILAHLLSGPVAQYSLQRALPYTRHASKGPRLAMTKMFIEAKVEGDTCHAVLRDAVCDDSADRDQELIDVLLAAGGSPMFNDSQSFRYAIRREDSGLFERLLASPAGISEGALSALMPDILTVKEQGARYYMMKSALDTRPKQDSVCWALFRIVSEKDVDMPLLRLLVHSGQVDIDYSNGVILTTGIRAARPVFEELLRLSDRSRSTTSAALVTVLELKEWDDRIKADRIVLLLANKKIPTVASDGVLRYIAFCRENVPDGEAWPLQTFEVLLNSGAYIEVLSREGALLDVARAGEAGLLAMLLTLKPASSDLDAALLEAIKSHSANTIAIVQLILQDGPTRGGISTSLVAASSANLREICSILLKHDASINSNNFAAIQNAAASGDPSLLNTFLESRPSQEAIEAAFNSASSVIDSDQRYETIQAILRSGIRQETLDKYLVHQVNHGTQPRMIRLLLDHQANVHYHQNYSLVQAAVQTDLEIVQILFSRATNKPTIATQCFEACVQSNQIQRDRLPVLCFLLDTGARGRSLNGALLQAVHNLSSQPALIDLVKVLIACGADVNHDQGQALCRACETIGPEAIAVLTRSNPSTGVRSRAIHSLLKSNISSQNFCQILDLLMDTENSTSDAPDISVLQEGFENPVKLLLTKRPDGVTELAHVLECQTKLLTLPENSDILAWAMVQERIRIQDDCLSLLLDHGANVNYRNPQTGCTILLQAIRCRRSELVEPLLLHGADTSVADIQGTSPLLLASILGDQIAIAKLLDTGVPKNDGSLHHAVCDLKVQVMEQLLADGHDANYPSPQHEGRTPLAELLCLGEASPSNQGTIEKVIQILRRHGADTRKLVARKPLICWALDNKHDPVSMVQSLLRAYLYQDVDEEFNFYNNGRFIYSPTMYVAKRQFTGVEARADELVGLLRNSGANKDVYYCLNGPQPEDAQGLPEDVARIEMLRRAKLAMRQEEEEDLERRRRKDAEERDRLRRIDEETYRRRKEREEEDFQRQLSYRRRLELEDQRALRERNELGIILNSEAEAAKRRELRAAHDMEVTLSARRAENEKKLLHDRYEALRLERANEIQHRTTLGELEVGSTKQRLLLENDHQKMAAAAAQSAMEAQHKTQQQLLSSQDHYQERSHNRRMKQLAMEKAMPVGSFAPSGGGFIEN